MSNNRKALPLIDHSSRLLGMPWGGIFEPWRPLVVVSAAAEGFYRPEKPTKPGKPVQLELFAAPAPRRVAPCSREFHRPPAPAPPRPVTAADPITDDDIPF